MMNILNTDVIKNFVRLCNDSWELGYNERNGGNASYRMTEKEIEECSPAFAYKSDWVELGVCEDNLKNEFFIVTGTGKFFRNTVLAPEENICIVQINDKGDSYRIVWGLTKGGGPTSEFPTHFMNHSVRKRVTGSSCRVVYHAHPVNIIALTFVLPLTDKEFSQKIWQSMTECPVIFPEGLGVVEWMIPGGVEIAKATCKKMETYAAVVWAHHGLFVTGDTFDEAFGLMHTIEKSAEIYIKALSCGQGIKQTIPLEKLPDVANAFGKEINKSLL